VVQTLDEGKTLDEIRILKEEKQFEVIRELAKLRIQLLASRTALGSAMVGGSTSHANVARCALPFTAQRIWARVLEEGCLPVRISLSCSSPSYAKKGPARIRAVLTCRAEGRRCALHLS
jgi:hypothetical protein